MERDFLGAIGRKEKGGEAKVAKTKQSDYLGGVPSMQRQFPAKAGAALAFMSFRAAREEDSKDVFDAINKEVPPVIAHQQRLFGFDGQVNPQQYAAAEHGHRAQGMESYGVVANHLLGGSRIFHAASMPRHAVPFNPANPMLRVESLPNVSGGSPFKNQSFTLRNAVAGSTVGVFDGARDPRNPKLIQMTIFYNGLVNVFDNVPVEKAQELMLLASRASIPSSPSAARKSDSPIAATAKVVVPEVLPARQIIIQKPEPSAPHVTGISSPIPMVTQAVTIPKSSSSSNNDTAGPKSAGVPSVVPPASQASSSQPLPLATTTAASVMPRRIHAVPQARKASLTRFLEKRKERVSSVTPYPSSKSPLESTDICPIVLRAAKEHQLQLRGAPQHKVSDLKPDSLLIL